MKRMIFSCVFVLLALELKTAAAQGVDTPIENLIVYKTPRVYKPFQLTGRVIGINLENVQSATVINICTAEKTMTDSFGIYHINAAKGDTLEFQFQKYSNELRRVGTQSGNMNIILIKRKTDNFNPGGQQTDYSKAKKDDDELYRILEKDAKLEGKWKY